MQNSIINENIEEIKEGIYKQFMVRTLEDYKDNKYISLNCKLLHYLSEPSLYYSIIIHKNTEINPFDKEIKLCFEFINGETPYVTILNDLNYLVLNDNRNYFRCLTMEHNYVFYLDKYNLAKYMLKEMISGIRNFLSYVKETIEINYFVYFGEYEFNHVYQINDFLMNYNNIFFYRIYKIKDKIQKEKYIIFTKLYFLVFQPLESDKALMKLSFYMELNEINFNFDKNEENQSLILDLTKTKYKKKFELVLIDRKHHRLKGSNNFNFDKEKNDIINDYSTLIKKWFTHQNYNINIFKKYNSIIKNYRMIFNQYKDKLYSIKINDINVDEYNKLIDFYENIINNYETKKELYAKNKERIHEVISNLVYLCSELVNFDKDKPKTNNKYLIIIKKYLNSYK